MTGKYVELTTADLAERWREKSLDESVDSAMSEYDGEKYATPDTALRHLLNLAWSELQESRRTALNGRWSVKCDWAVHRIMGLTDLVGPIGWESVPADLILDGVYERVHDNIGHPTPLTAADRLRAQEVLGQRRD